MRFLISSCVFLAATAASADPAKLTVMSDAFGTGATIPAEYTCDGAKEAPLLTWTAPPPGTKSIAILVDDPDAKSGPFTHLLVTNLAPDRQSLDLGDAMPASADVLRNDSGTPGYLAPCPEDGKHHYHYRVYALDARIALPRPEHPVTRESFLRAIAGHELAAGDLVGQYTPQNPAPTARR